MTRLNRYVLENFLRPLLFCYGTLTILVLMAEMMERLDKFIAGKAGVGVVLQYLLAVWPVRSQELFPMSALLATLFALGQLSRHREITAAMSGGVHPWRLTAPLLYVGVALSVLSWGLGESVTPWASRQAKKLWNTEIRHLTAPRPTQFENVTVAGKSAFYSIGLLDIQDERLKHIVIDIPVDGKPRSQWQAREGRWTVENGWTLVNGLERTFSEDGRALLLQSAFQEKRIPLQDKPSDLLPHEPDTEGMNHGDLGRHIRRLNALGVPTQKLEVEYHMKAALPWANLIVLLIGIPLAFNKRGGKVRALALALAVAFGYFGLMQLGRAFGQKTWCPPVAGAWMANITLLAIGARLFWRMRSQS